MNLSESYKKRLQELAGIISEDLNFISKQDATDRKMFGPVYHGAPQEKLDKIQSQGFKIFYGSGRSGDVSNGYQDTDYSSGYPAPIHHLGYGIYFTTVKNIAKNFNANTTKGLKEYYLDIPRLETINFASPKNMMKWWIDNGYDAELSKTDRVAATKRLTDYLKSKYDAVWFKGTGLKRLLDGDQIAVFDPSRIYQINQDLSKELEIGSKVISTVDFKNVLKGTVGIINGKQNAQQMRDYWEKNNNGTPHWTKNSEYAYEIK